MPQGDQPFQLHTKYRNSEFYRTNLNYRGTRRKPLPVEVAKGPMWPNKQKAPGDPWAPRR